MSAADFPFELGAGSFLLPEPSFRLRGRCGFPAFQRRHVFPQNKRESWPVHANDYRWQ